MQLIYNRDIEVANLTIYKDYKIIKLAELSSSLCQLDMPYLVSGPMPMALT